MLLNFGYLSNLVWAVLAVCLFISLLADFELYDSLEKWILNGFRMKFTIFFFTFLSWGTFFYVAYLITPDRACARLCCCVQCTQAREGRRCSSAICLVYFSFQRAQKGARTIFLQKGASMNLAYGRHESSHRPWSSGIPKRTLACKL